MIEVEKISGIFEFETGEKTLGEDVDAETVKVFLVNGKAFLVERKNTLEVRTDRKLGLRLREEYESVMESRYFGRGGIELVNSGQLDEAAVEDLIRLSYNLTKEENENQGQ